MLRQAYEAMQRRNGSANSPLEVVYISTDRSYDEFSAYVAEEMPWLAVAYENEEMRKGIQQLFGVTGVPTLVIVDPADGQIITMNATDDVRQDLSARKFPWGQRRSEKKDRSSVGAAARPEDASMDESASGGVAGGAANADAPTSASADGPAADEGEDLVRELVVAQRQRRISGRRRVVVVVCRRWRWGGRRLFCCCY
jgi:hypothetical protein